ncbi:ABC transporter permease [Allorhizobium pseudoryzae]|uniref:ABC transporter permease n=1 Tax=Allorhizobium pseudoryzae TaxID=379684 RepID=UPI003D093AE8
MIGELILRVFCNAWRERALIGRLVNREVQARYRGSLLGFVWAIVLPLATIGIYTFVFGSIFKARWSVPAGADSEYGFGSILFVGFIVFGLFSEPFNRAPSLMLENSSYIKKVVFPLEVLPWVSLGTAIVNSGLSFLVFLGVYVTFYGIPSILWILIPLIIAPVIFITLGVTYALSSLGVYVRDIRQFTPLLTTMLMFLSPVLYPLENVPEQYRAIVLANPLTIGIQQVREIIFDAQVPDLREWALYLLASLIVLWLGFVWFERTKKGFADVL